ncbi:MAG: hypothetical protein CL537_02155 [Alcanivoracaceae bacterium]|uniref:hypothetical protein n=1 Tax=Alcanivorax sp. MD8A TaxID=1177157 RepID=UPI000C426FC7|nr:hypothetical protein [Alcanivorax sp. MD8A]MAX54312.1 hypothetical protein [Alcanivoracaceae bacterium]MCG8436716.1 hypothetical protein [Pseudomonadales bacterium]MEE2869358.1 hypothetical protein [Pseudomonadota bacterium]PNE03427.1 hypothetical protein A15D_00895 [Alcanivorax sp. MD8A]|tara:strand:- start:2185 stop:2832 length:648 start_codon:yes stop_codon:yes gene_type:complete
MNYTLAPLVLFAFSLIFVLLGATVLLRQRWLLQWLKGTAGILLVVAAVYLSLFALNIYGYKEYAQEVPVATVSFRQSGEQSFIATVTRTDGSAEDFRLKGDQWQLDARIIKWRVPFSLLGLKPGYQLDRISGRYYALEDERSRDRTVYSLHRDPVGIDVWQMANDGWSVLIDARYGSAAYLPMADGALFEVNAGATGLVARPMNGAAQQAISGWN